MIDNYRRELEEYKLRLLQMEKVEIQRMAKESAYEEELFNNHGKPLTFFQVPKLATRTRSNSRRFRKLQGKIGQDKEELERKQKQKSKSIGRHSKFALTPEHDRLKEMISQRENALKELLEQSKGQVDFLK